MNFKEVNRKKFIMLMGFGFICLILAGLYSMTKGAAQMSVQDLLQVIWHYDAENPKHVLIMQMRLPRIIAAAMIGASLATAGALMQGLTRNPMADSGLMGLSSGAVFMVALAYVVFEPISYGMVMFLAFIGAALGVLSVYGISAAAPGGNQAMKLILAGATMTALLSALSQGIAILGGAAQSMSFWTMGSVSGTTWQTVAWAVIPVTSGLTLALILSRSVGLIFLGEDMAKSVGVNVGLVRVIGMIIVVLLSGTSVAIAGMVSFVGIIVPHFAKLLFGNRYTMIIPASILFGSLLLVLADIGSKSIRPPGEIPIGAIIAMIGVPIFLWIAKLKKEVV